MACSNSLDDGFEYIWFSWQKMLQDACGFNLTKGDIVLSSTEFIKQYEAALGTQDWTTVAPLISDEAVVIFSDGSLHAGKDAIRIAYERNFDAIKNEAYRIENVRWLLQTPDSAAYMFDFFWAGVFQGRDASGSGRGTAVLERRSGRWMLAGEQLGPKI